MTKLLRKVRDFAHSHPMLQVCVVRASTFGHIAYFGAVSIEGHGMYSAMASVMAIITVVSVTLGVEA